jgi:hypothetical protein
MVCFTFPSRSDTIVMTEQFMINDALTVPSFDARRNARADENRD